MIAPYGNRTGASVYVIKTQSDELRPHDVITRDGCCKTRIRYNTADFRLETGKLQNTFIQ